jgi:Holliday junction resolvase RusA-like endonuclease
MKKLDDDNFWAAMKATRDGLADAGIVANDKQFVIGSLTWAKERTAELVITLTEVEYASTEGE